MGQDDQIQSAHNGGNKGSNGRDLPTNFHMLILDGFLACMMK